MKKRVMIFQVLISLLIIISLFLIFKDVSYLDIVNSAPNNYFLKIIFLLCLYCLKSLVIFFPIVALQIATGLLFDIKIAIIVNIIGMLLVVILPYIIGLKIPKETVLQIFKKYPRLGIIEKVQVNSATFFVYITRILGLPMDVVSIYMGISKMELKRYLLGSLLGVLPGSLIIVIMSKSIVTNNYGLLALLMIVMLIIAIISIMIYYLKIKRQE